MFGRIPLVLLAVLSVALVSACRRNDPPLAAGDRDVAVSIPDRVKVLNGDILVVDGKHVRLANARTPEQIPAADCWAEALAAKQTTHWVRQLVRGARTVTVRPTGKMDADRRGISYVAFDGADLGEVLVAQGMAAPVTPEPFSWCGRISQSPAPGPSVAALLDLGTP
jgi:endonuclease YncB( thermonuclease family)